MRMASDLSGFRAIPFWQNHVWRETRHDCKAEIWSLSSDGVRATYSWVSSAYCCCWTLWILEILDIPICIEYCCITFILEVLTLLWCSWLGNRKGIWPVKTALKSFAIGGVKLYSIQKSFAIAVNVSGWGIAQSTLWTIPPAYFRRRVWSTCMYWMSLYSVYLGGAWPLRMFKGVTS